MRAALVAVVVLTSAAHAETRLVAIAPADDVRKAAIVGSNGEVFEGDGKGGFARHLQVTTADTITAAGRTGDAIVAIGDGVVYRLEANGWSSIRVANKLHAVLASGGHAVAAAGRQVVSVSREAHGEAATLATAGSAVLALGAGKTVVLATDRGVFRIDGKKVTAVKGAPKHVASFAGDRWALVDRGAADLRGGGKVTAWPTDVTVKAAAQAPDDRLFAVATVKGGGAVVLVVGAAKVERLKVDVTVTAAPVAIAADAGGRILVAFEDGHVAVHEKSAWVSSQVVDMPPDPHPGAPPATSP